MKRKKYHLHYEKWHQSPESMVMFGAVLVIPKYPHIGYMEYTYGCLVPYVCHSESAGRALCCSIVLISRTNCRESAEGPLCLSYFHICYFRTTITPNSSGVTFIFFYVSISLIVFNMFQIIKLITFTTSGGAYLNFMGNEFAHPKVSVHCSWKEFYSLYFFPNF